MIKKLKFIYFNYLQNSRTIVVQSEAVPEDELGDSGTLEATEAAMASLQQQQDGSVGGVNLYTLAGHEAMQL